MTSSRLEQSAGSLLQLGLCAFPTPPGWAQNSSEMQVAPSNEEAL